MEEVAETVKLHRLLALTLQPKAPKITVNRIWDLRQVLSACLEQQNHESEDLLTKLETCFKSSAYLDSKKGLKFLAWALQQERVPLSRMHHLVKDQLLICSLKHAETYGRIYYEAWINSSAMFQKKFEDICLSDVIEEAIHFYRKANDPIFNKLCAFLNCFHEKRNKVEVAAMLIRLYDPIIWRSLKVANCLVRGNAAQLLFDVYPLVNPDTKDQQELSLNKQYNEMKGLLTDPVPEVRCIAANGLFNCLRIAWESLPPEVIRNWLETLLGPCLHDGHSSRLRCKVIKGLCNLLDNPLCHQTLEALLPNIRDSFHDVSEKVREAFCVLLKKVNSVEGFKYWEIVPVEHLLARVQEDSPNICELIVDLTCKNLLPGKKSEQRMLERSLYLFKTNIVASWTYIRHWCLRTSLDVVTSFMKLWNNCLLCFVLENSKVNDSYCSNEDTSVSSVQSSPLDDPVMLCGVINAMCLSWKTLNSQLLLPENKPYRKELLIVFEKSMPKALLFFRDAPSFLWNPLLLLASSLCLDSLKPHLAVSMSRLKKLAEDASPETFDPLVGSLVYQGRGRDLLELLADWINRGLPSTAHSSAGGAPSSLPLAQQGQVRCTGGRRVCFEEVPPKARLALSVLQFLLNYPEVQIRVFVENRSYLLEDFLPILRRIKELIGESCRGEKELSFSKDLAVQSFSLHCQVLVLLHRQDVPEDFSSIRSMEEIMMWVSDVLVPLLSSTQVPSQTDDNPVPTEEQRERTKRKKKRGKKRQLETGETQGESVTDSASVIVDVIKVFLGHTSDMILLNLYDTDFLTAFCTFVSNLLKSGNGSNFLSESCRCLYQLVGQVVLKEVSPSDQTVSLLSCLISAILNKITKDYDQCSEETGSESLVSCSQLLSQCLQLLLRHFTSSRFLMAEVLAMILATIMANISNHISKMEVVECCDLSEAPPLTCLILEQVIGRVNCNIFVSGLEIFLEGVRQPLPLLAFVCCLSYVLTKIGKRHVFASSRNEYEKVVRNAESLLLKVTGNVREQYEQEENLFQIPEVIYCRLSQKLLEQIKQQQQQSSEH